MSETLVIPYAEALAQAKASDGEVHLLLGNGFSVACRPDIFAYKALFDRADFGSLSAEARRAFDILGTRDFEVVMRGLRTAAGLLELYSLEQSELPAIFVRDAEGLANVLVEAIAENHPDQPGEISQVEFESCRRFLANFDDIYTVNYDLLLYWALMQKELEPFVRADDGFRMPEDGPEEYVTWEVENTKKECIFYLHGALHLFDSGPEVKKFTWTNTGRRLTEQIREALGQGMYPLIVAESTAREKKTRINHSNYLSRAYRSFGSLGGSMFVFGHSFAENDDHIISLLEKQRCKVKRIFIGIYEDPASSHNQEIFVRGDLMKLRRPRLEVHYYRAHEADVWGH